ncbi:MAG: hypothetical protein HS124_05015 [Anaerolineales bacterium]|nr:hypothetical protein [Anaerolineales bacterium]
MRSKSILLFFVMILLTSCAAPTPQATVIPQTSEVFETPEVLTATSTPVQRLVVTPSAPQAELSSSAEIDSSNAAPPEWIIGNFEEMGLPEDLQATSWDGEKYASLRQHGLVPALQDGHVVNYAKKNGIVYAPQLTQIGDEEAPVLTPQGPLAPGGTIIEYASPDGKVVRNMRVGIACPDNAVCMQVVKVQPRGICLPCTGRNWIGRQANFLATCRHLLTTQAVEECGSQWVTSGQVASRDRRRSWQVKDTG